MTEEPYKLPPGWRWVRLGEVCEINPRRPRLNRAETAATSFVPMDAVDEDTGTIKNIQPRPFAEVRRGYTYFEEGDVLFAKITPCMENGKAAIAEELTDGIGFGSTEFHVLRPQPQVLARWIWLFVRQERFRAEAKRTFRGAVGHQRVHESFLEIYPVPLPPLSKQQRIVARIEELMERVREAKRLRAEARNDADRLMQAALAEVFPRPGSPLPPGWRWVKLSEVVDCPRQLVDPRRFPEETFLLYSLPAYDVGEGPEEALGSDIGSAKLLVGAGMVLFSKLNPRIPRVWVVEENGSHRKLSSTEFLPLEPHSAALERDFLRLLLLSETFRGQVRTDVLGATGSRQRLKKETVLRGVIPLPPLGEQRRIVVYLDEVQVKVTCLEQAQVETDAELRRLEQSILNAAFRGWRAP